MSDFVDLAFLQTPSGIANIKACMDNIGTISYPAFRALR